MLAFAKGLPDFTKAKKKQMLSTFVNLRVMVYEKDLYKHSKTKIFLLKLLKPFFFNLFLSELNFSHLLQEL